MIRGTTQVLGVIGYPIEHSLSPIMHNAAIATLGVDYAYLPFAIAPHDLPTAVAGLWALGVQGFNVTIPHKQAIMPLLHEISPVAQAIGAVNTVYRTATGWGGTNTDAIGFLAPLKAMPRNWSTAHAVILGNGGAARAVVAGCAQLGCESITVVGRDAAKLNAFLHSWSDPHIAQRLSVKPWEALPTLLREATLLVNTTPVGMHPHDTDSPITDEEATLVPAGAIAYDLIYTPRPTRFLRQIQGATTLDGLEMLVQQGAAALELWLQQPVPVDVMRRSLEAHLSR